MFRACIENVLSSLSTPVRAGSGCIVGLRVIGNLSVLSSLGELWQVLLRRLHCWQLESHKFNGTAICVVVFAVLVVAEWL